MEQVLQNNPIIWTIGHSNKPFIDFAELLLSADVQTVIDCRSKPYSRFQQYNQSRLARALEDCGILYEYRGHNLGGLGVNIEQEEAIDELAQRSRHDERIALLCSEGKPQECHRGTVLTPLFNEQQVSIEHLLYE